MNPAGVHSISVIDVVEVKVVVVDVEVVVSQYSKNLPFLSSVLISVCPDSKSSSLSSSAMFLFKNRLNNFQIMNNLEKS